MEGMKPVKIYSCADRVDADRAKEIVKALTLPLEEKTDEADVDIPARSSDKRLRVVRIISLIAAVLVVIGAVVPSLINILFG